MINEKKTKFMYTKNTLRKITKSDILFNNKFQKRILTPKKYNEYY